MKRTKAQELECLRRESSRLNWLLQGRRSVRFVEFVQNRLSAIANRVAILTGKETA